MGGVAQFLGLAGDPAKDVLGVASLVVSGAEFAVGLVADQHVPDRAQDAVLERDDGLQSTDAWFEAVMTVLQERVVDLHAGHGGLAWLCQLELAPG